MQRVVRGLIASSVLIIPTVIGVKVLAEPNAKKFEETLTPEQRRIFEDRAPVTSKDLEVRQLYALTCTKQLHIIEHACLSHTIVSFFLTSQNMINKSLSTKGRMRMSDYDGRIDYIDKIKQQDPSPTGRTFPELSAATASTNDAEK